MCDLTKCVYRHARSGQNLDMGIRAAKILDLTIGRVRLGRLSAISIGMEGTYDVNYLLYRGSGTFAVHGDRDESGLWTIALSFRGTWAADFTMTGRCRESNRTCTISGTDNSGKMARVALTFTNATFLWRESIWIQVSRQGWLVPQLWFSPRQTRTPSDRT